MLEARMNYNQLEACLKEETENFSLDTILMSPSNASVSLFLIRMFFNLQISSATLKRGCCWGTAIDDHNEYGWTFHGCIKYIVSKVSMADFRSSVVLLSSPLFRSCRIYNHHATAQPCAGMVSLIKLSVKRKVARQNLALAPPEFWFTTMKSLRKRNLVFLFKMPFWLN